MGRLNSNDNDYCPHCGSQSCSQACYEGRLQDEPDYRETDNSTSPEFDRLQSERAAKLNEELLKRTRATQPESPNGKKNISKILWPIAILLMCVLCALLGTLVLIK